VAWTDELFGSFEDALGSLGLGDDTALIVLSDHGEGLGEHEESLHGFFAYQTTLHVPFLVRAPGIPKGRRLERTVRLVDLFPTALELPAAPVHGRARGPGLAAARGRPRAEEAATLPRHSCRCCIRLDDLRVIREERFTYRHLAPSSRPAGGPRRAARPRARAAAAGRRDAWRPREGAGARAQEPAAGQRVPRTRSSSGSAR
jgi:arylsulfatase A-like enzyme